MKIILENPPMDLVKITRLKNHINELFKVDLDLTVKGKNIILEAKK